MFNSDEAIGLSNLACKLVAAGSVAAGLVVHRRAIAVSGDWQQKLLAAADMVNHGLVDEAASLISQCPMNDPGVMVILAFVQLERGDPAGAARLLEMGCSARPGNADWRVSHAQAVLAAGDWERGFELHEIRPKRQALNGTFKRWDGSRVDRLLVWSDEGMGDAIMFARYIPLLAERVGKLVIGLPPEAHALMARFGKYGEFTAGSHAGMKLDAEVAMMSLPMYFGTMPDNIPPDPGLLSAGTINGSLVDASKRNIAIAWTGNQEFKRRHLRDMPLTAMLGLAEDRDNRLYSVVTGARAADIAQAGAQPLVTDLSGHVMSDFTATAAVINSMDAVVTTCCGIAHLAGALGKPTILCLATLADWRWLYGRDTTGWYPSIRLVRQRKPHEWRPVIDEARSLLNEMPIRRSREFGW